MVDWNHHLSLPKDFPALTMQQLLHCVKYQSRMPTPPFLSIPAEIVLSYLISVCCTVLNCAFITLVYANTHQLMFVISSHDSVVCVALCSTPVRFSPRHLRFTWHQVWLDRVTARNRSFVCLLAGSWVINFLSMSPFLLNDFGDSFSLILWPSSI